MQNLKQINKEFDYLLINLTNDNDFKDEYLDKLLVLLVKYEALEDSNVFKRITINDFENGADLYMKNQIFNILINLLNNSIDQKPVIISFIKELLIMIETYQNQLNDCVNKTIS